MEMLTYDEALETILQNVRTLGVENRALIEADGQVLAEDIYSDLDLPAYDISMPDGYAVQAKDIEKADKDNPAILKINGSSRAGYLPSRTVSAGTAMRIMTGSVVPEGADCVVKFEDTDEPENKSGPNLNNPTHVKIYASRAPGKFIHKAGDNIKKGALLLRKNTIIGPAQLSALAAIGEKTVRVFRRPEVAIITTGDELARDGAPLTPGKIYNSNEAAMRSLVTHYGGIPLVLGIARDNEKSLLAKIQKGLSADAVITTGGVSKGDYDLLRQVIGKMGELHISSIRMGPAMAFGLLKQPSGSKGHASIPIFALEGPPQGCMIDFEILVRPAMFRMRGIQELNHPVVEAIGEDSITNPRPVSFPVWTVLKKTGTGYTVSQGDAAGLAQKAPANSLSMIPGRTTMNAGDRIQVWPLDWYK
jgi:molybdopterin molybdotransferase